MPLCPMPTKPPCNAPVGMGAKNCAPMGWAQTANGPRHPPLCCFAPCKAPTFELQCVGGSRAARPPAHPQPRLAAKAQWALAPSGPTLWGGALASGVAKGQMGCALPPCQKETLALAQFAVGRWHWGSGRMFGGQLQSKTKKWAVLGCVVAPRL